MSYKKFKSYYSFNNISKIYYKSVDSLYLNEIASINLLILNNTMTNSELVTEIEKLLDKFSIYCNIKNSTSYIELQNLLSLLQKIVELEDKVCNCTCGAMAMSMQGNFAFDTGIKSEYIEYINLYGLPCDWNFDPLLLESIKIILNNKTLQ